MRLKDHFAFDSDAFWGSSAVEEMTGEQGFAYLRLLCRQWADGFILADPKKVALALNSGCRFFTEKDVVGRDGTLADPDEGSLWSAIGRCFSQEIDEKSGKKVLKNERVDTERAEWIRKKNRWARAGKKAGKASATMRKKSKADSNDR